MEIAPPPPDPPPGGGRMPHTHYGPVMGVRPRGKKRRHGESVQGSEVAEGRLVDDYLDGTYGSGDGTYASKFTYYDATPLWDAAAGSPGTPEFLSRVRMENQHLEEARDRLPRTNLAVGFHNSLVEYREQDPDSIRRFIQTVNTVPLPAYGRPVPSETPQTSFRIELPDFLGDPSDPTSRYYNPRRQRRQWSQRPTDVDDNPEYEERFRRVAAASQLLQLREWSPL